MLSSSSGTRIIGYIRPDNKSKTPLVVAAREEQLLGFCVSVPSIKGEHQYFVDEEFSDLLEVQKDPVLLFDYFHSKLTKTSSISQPKSQGVESDEDQEEEHKEPEKDPDPRLVVDPEEDNLHLDDPPPSVQMLSETDPARSPADSENLNAKSTPDVQPSQVLPKLRVRKDILMKEPVEVIDLEASGSGPDPGVDTLDNGMNLMRDCRFLIQEPQPSVVQHHRPRLPAITSTNTAPPHPHPHPLRQPPPHYQEQNQVSLRPVLIQPRQLPAQSASAISTPPGQEEDQFRVTYSQISQKSQLEMSTHTRGATRLGSLSAASSAPRPYPVPRSARTPGPRPRLGLTRGPRQRPGPTTGHRPGQAPGPARTGQPSVRSGLSILSARSPQPVISQQRGSTGNVENIVCFSLKHLINTCSCSSENYGLSQDAEDSGFSV